MKRLTNAMIYKYKKNVGSFATIIVLLETFDKSKLYISIQCLADSYIANIIIIEGNFPVLESISSLCCFFHLILIKLSTNAIASYRVSEPGGSETLRHPVDILLLELMKAYIFLSL